MGGGGGVSKLLSPQGDLTGHDGDTVTGALGDALDSLGDFPRAVGRFEGAFFLDVEVLGVLADDDQVDGRFGGCGPASGFHGAHVSVEVELFAQGDDRG